ncbi:MAG TPA: HEAT repeat domain-containing protein [Gemmata sp.]|nr:HEAT repeat domain-containing protein [Gemmata sp.]
MPAARFVKALSAVALFNALLYFALGPTAALANDEADAKKYTQDLRKGKDAKTKVAALTELGKIAVIQKRLVADALPDIYKALEDKDASVRAAAAQTLGACDEPADKAIPALVKVLKDDKEMGPKVGAARGLASMGPAAKSALPTLREYAKDKANKQLSAASKAALKSIVQKQ